MGSNGQAVEGRALHPLAEDGFKIAHGRRERMPAEGVIAARFSGFGFCGTELEKIKGAVTEQSLDFRISLNEPSHESGHQAEVGKAGVDVGVFIVFVDVDELKIFVNFRKTV